jgi:hypothetical protein
MNKSSESFCHYLLERVPAALILCGGVSLTFWMVLEFSSSSIIAKITCCISIFFAGLSALTTYFFYRFSTWDYTIERVSARNIEMVAAFLEAGLDRKLPVEDAIRIISTIREKVKSEEALTEPEMIFLDLVITASRAKRAIKLCIAAGLSVIIIGGLILIAALYAHQINTQQ